MANTKIKYNQLKEIPYKKPCVVATTTNIDDLSSVAPNTLDGVSLSVGDRVLVKNQITASQNGIYEVVTVGTGVNGSWVRAYDFENDYDVYDGIFSYVTNGTTNGDSLYYLNTPDPIVIGSTSLTFSVYSSSTTPNLEQVLTQGNVTGNYNIDVNDGYGIGSQVAGLIKTGIEFDGQEFTLKTYDEDILSPTWGSVEMNFSPTGLTVGQVANIGIFRGIEYEEDFSSNYTNRSLVDKEYVDNIISASAISGTGTNNYLTKWTIDGSTLVDSLIYDNGTNVGIGTTTPTETLHVNGNIFLQTTSNRLKMSANGEIFPFSSSPFRGVLHDAGNANTGWRGAHRFRVAYEGINYRDALFIGANTDTSTSNIGVNTITPTAQFEINPDSSLSSRSILKVDEFNIAGNGNVNLNNKTYAFDTSISAFFYLDQSTNDYLRLSAGSSPGIEIRGQQTTSKIQIENFADNFDGEIIMKRWKGDWASASSSILPVTNNTELGSFRFYGGYATGSTSNTEGFNISVQASEDWDTNNVGTKVTFTKHNNGDSQSSLLSTVLQFDGDGNSSFGNNRVSTTKQFKAGTNPTGVISSNSFTFDCDAGMTQRLDLQAATSSSTLTFSNQLDGNTYTLIVVQGSGTYDLTFPSGWWLNDTAPFDFTTLANDERAMVTATYLDFEWFFAVKKLTQVV